MTTGHPVPGSPAPFAPAARHFGLLAARLILALVCAALLAAPFPIAFYLHNRAKVIGPQQTTSAATFTSEQSARFRAVADQSGAPLILCYHDISPTSRSRYAVTPAAFEAQMAMLHAAGYQPLTTGQFVYYLHGGSVPPHSVLITFDDGTQGLWTYADRILARYHLTAVSFVITSRVGTHRPYYLTWPEIGRMRQSGRWDFGSHTRNLHNRVAIDSTGTLGSPLTNRRWLPRQQRRETPAAFHTRVRADLQASITDLTDHGLPRPRLFAYPFSANGAYTHRVLRSLFAASMTDHDPAAPVSRREASSGLLARIEMTRHDTAGTAFRRMQRTRSLPTGDLSAAHHPSAWRNPGGSPAPVAYRKHHLTFTSHTATYAQAAYAPFRTADWATYHLATDVTHLDRTDNTGMVTVRTGAPGAIEISIANHYMSIYHNGNSYARVLYQTRLRPSTRHHLAVQVTPRETRITVGTHSYYIRRLRHSAVAESGGFTLAGHRASHAGHFVRFTHLFVRAGVHR